jgi:hypothetical protein
MLNKAEEKNAGVQGLRAAMVERRFRLPAWAVVVICLACFYCAPAFCRAERQEPSKELSRAEAILDKLQRLDTTVDPQSHDGREALKRANVSLRRAAARLDDSSLKTELATAIRLFGLAARADTENSAGSLTLRSCSAEPAGAYRRLCESRRPSFTNLLREKARAHLKWAEALILKQKGAVDGATALALLELEAELQIDRTMAARALDLLKSLEGNVRIYNSLSEFEEGRALSDISYEKFACKLRDVADTVGVILYRLRENKLRQYLHNALQSYLDGSFWWKKAYRPAVIDVARSGLHFEQDAETMGPQAFDPNSVSYTVAIHWRQAQKFTRRAETLYSNQ